MTDRPPRSKYAVLPSDLLTALKATASTVNAMMTLGQGSSQSILDALGKDEARVDPTRVVHLGRELYGVAKELPDDLRGARQHIRAIAVELCCLESTEPQPTNHLFEEIGVSWRQDGEVWVHDGRSLGARVWVEHGVWAWKINALDGQVLATGAADTAELGRAFVTVWVSGHRANHTTRYLESELTRWELDTLLAWARHFGADDGSWPEGQALFDRLQSMRSGSVDGDEAPDV